MPSPNSLQTSIKAEAKKVLRNKRASVLDQVRASLILGEAPLNAAVAEKREQLQEVWGIVKVTMDKNMAANQLVTTMGVTLPTAYKLIHDACTIFGEMGHVTPELGRVLSTSYISVIIQKAMEGEKPDLEIALKALKLYAKVTGADTFSEEDKKDIPQLLSLIHI
jgi:hypothetical protein